MTITLFEQKDFGPVFFDLPGDLANLKDSPVGYKTKSLRMTGRGDRALFFTKRNWDGRVMVRLGPVDIPNVGRSKDGGKSGFANDIRSVRTSNFTIRYVYHVIRDENGVNPAGLNDRDMRNYLRAINSFMNDIWDEAFIRFDRLRDNEYQNRTIYNFRERFSLIKNSNAFSLERAALNIFVVNTREKQVIGTGSRLKELKNAGVCVIALSQGSGDLITAGNAGKIAAHEVGHVLGLSHGSAKGNRTNVMFNTLGPNRTDNTRFNRDQVERVHKRLSRSGEGAAFRIE